MLFHRKETAEAAVTVYSYEIEPEAASEEAAGETTTITSNCAWCGDPPNEYGSHGICAFHAEQMERQSAWRKLQKTPSYAERFKRR